MFYTALSYSQLVARVQNLSHNLTQEEHFLGNNDWEGSHEDKLISIGLAINTFWLPIIIPTGLVGNILSLVVMLQRHNRKSTCAIYLSALAVCDSVVLLLGLYLWSSLTFDAAMTWGSCAMPTYFLLTSTQCGTFIMVSMTCDRCVAVKWPLKSKSYFTVRRTKMSLVAMCIFSLIFNIPHVFITKLLDSRTCASFAVDQPVVLVYSWLSIFLNAIVPFCLLLVMNTSIIAAIRDRSSYFRNKNHDALESANAESRISLRDETRVDKHENQLTVMLLCVTFVFILLTMPQYTRYIVYTFIPMDDDPSTFATFVLIYHITNKAFYTNSAVNFWLYVASGSKFRNDLQRLCCQRTTNKRRMSTSGSSTRTKSTDVALSPMATQTERLVR